MIWGFYIRSLLGNSLWMLNRASTVCTFQCSGQERLFQDLMGDTFRGKLEDQQTNLQSKTDLKQIHS